jgi:hypothetical protein
MAKKPSKFTPLTSSIPRRLVWRSWGREKSGKNHFGLTAPGPVYGLYFDPGGLEGMVEKFLDEKEVHAIQFRFNKKRNGQDEAKALKQDWIDAYEEALNNAKTIQWDETELWELCRFAEWGRESAKGREYGPLNGEYRGWIQDAFDAGVNLQLIQKVKEEWIDDKPSGEMVPFGFKQAGNIVQVNLEHSYTPPEDPDAPKADGFNVKIYECRQNMGLSFENYGNIDFATLGCLIYPDSEAEEWQ